MKLMTSGTFLASALALLALGACGPAKDGDPAAKGPAAATVNGKAISARIVDTLAKQGAGQGRPDTPQTRRAIIDQLALQMLAADEAVKKGLDKSPLVAEEIETIRQSILANAYVQDLIKSSPVTEDMVKAEYERIKATVSGTEYKARHILVEKESEARDIIARLRKDPGAFAKLAKEKSMDTGSKARGGDLGWFDARRMVPEFGAAVGKLEKGKLTQEPVRSQYGYHVIALDDAKPIEAPPLEEVRPQLTQQLEQQNVSKRLEALKAGAKIEVVGASAASPAPTPAPPVPDAIKSK